MITVPRATSITVGPIQLSTEQAKASGMVRTVPGARLRVPGAGSRKGSRDVGTCVTPGSASAIMEQPLYCLFCGLVIATMSTAAWASHALREDMAQYRPHRLELRQLPSHLLSAVAVVPAQAASPGPTPPVIVQFFNPTKSKGGIDFCLDGNVGANVNGDVNTGKTGCQQYLGPQMFVWDWGDSTRTWGRVKLVSCTIVGMNLCLDNRGMTETTAASARLRLVPCDTADPANVAWSTIQDLGAAQKEALKIPASNALAGLLRSKTRSSVCMDDGGFLSSKPSPEWTLGRCDPKDPDQIISQHQPAWTVNNLWDAGDGTKHFMLRLRDASQCLDVKGNVAGDAWFTDCDPSNPNQFFLFRVNADNTLTAGNIESYGVARGCLDHNGGNNLYLWECMDFNGNQQFTLEKSTGVLRGWFAVRQNSCLDSLGGEPRTAKLRPCKSSSQQRIDMVLQAPPTVPKFFTDSPPEMVQFFNPTKSKGGLNYCMDGNGDVATTLDGCQWNAMDQMFVWLWGDQTRTWGRIKAAGAGNLCLDNRGMTAGTLPLRFVNCASVGPDNLLWSTVQDLRADQKTALRLPATIGHAGLLRPYKRRSLCVDDGGFLRNADTTWTLSRCNPKDPNQIVKQQQLAWTVNKLWDAQNAGGKTFTLSLRNDPTKCLDVGEGDGPVQFSTCIRSRPNQCFFFQPNSDATLTAGRIQSYATSSCLTESASLEACGENGEYEQFILEKSTGLLRRWSTSGGNSCLDAQGGSPEFQTCSKSSSRIEMVLQSLPSGPSFFPDTPPAIVRFLNPTKSAGTRSCLDANAGRDGVDGSAGTSECALELSQVFVWLWGDKKNKTWGRIKLMWTDLCLDNRGIKESTVGKASLRMVPCGAATPENILWSTVENFSAAQKKALGLPASIGAVGLLRSFSTPTLCMAKRTSSEEWTLKQCSSRDPDQAIQQVPAWTVNKLWEAQEGTFTLRLKDEPNKCLDGRSGESVPWFTACNPTRLNQFFSFRSSLDNTLPTALIQSFRNAECLDDSNLRQHTATLFECSTGVNINQHFDLQESTGLLRTFIKMFQGDEVCLDSNGGEPEQASFQPCDENSSQQRIFLYPESSPTQNMSTVSIILAWKRTLKGGDRILISWRGQNPCLAWIGIICSDANSVIRIDVSDSLIQGTISPDLGKISSLQYLNISNNRFQGGIPAELGQLSGLKFLDLSNNQLTGSVPADILSLNLTRGLLNNNYLTGNISTGRTDLSQVLDLAANFFTSAACDGVSRQLNCLAPRGCKLDGIQRQATECSGFCGTTSALGACGGHGSCFLSDPERYPTCACYPGFRTSSTAQGTCESGYAPPPPPLAEARSNYTLGVNFLDYAPRMLNQHSRYLSAGSFLENGVPNWSLKMASSWMAPFWIFPSTVFKYGLPDDYDDEGVLTWGPVRDQGNCSSCWAAASIDAVSAAVFSTQSSRGGAIPALSAEQVVQCFGERTAKDECSGGYPMNALEYATEHVLAQDGRFSTCPSAAQGGLATILMYESVQFRGWLGLLLTLQFQAALVIIQGSSRVFQKPSCAKAGFVLDDPSCYDGDLDHTVLVVGYDMTNPQTPYWVVRNSWGEGWCSKGYMRLGIQGGDGTCGMNVLPAYYPVPRPAPDDPCYSKSTISSGSPSRVGVLNPCGGGQCSPWEDGGYTCSCPQQYVAVNITVPGLKTSAQSCVPVDACKLSLLNPCGVGYCVNDGNGGYVCVCPLGYINGEFVTEKPTCVFLGTPKGDTSLTVTEGLTCQVIAVTYNLTIPALESQNLGLNCSDLTAGSKVNVTNAMYQCDAGYIATSKDKNCGDVLVSTGMAYTALAYSPGKDVTAKIEAATEELQRRNVGLDCTSITAGQPVCLRSNKSKNVVCTKWAFMEWTDCGKAALELFPEDPARFFHLNPGLDCGNLAKSTGLPKEVSTRGEKVCTGSKSSGTIVCKDGLSAYRLKKRDTCQKLVSKGFFQKYKNINQINQNLDCSSPTVGQLICYRPMKNRFLKV